MHSKDTLKAGENQQRVFAISAWWETPFFTDVVVTCSWNKLTIATHMVAEKDEFRLVDNFNLI